MPNQIGLNDHNAKKPQEGMLVLYAKSWIVQRTQYRQVFSRQNSRAVAVLKIDNRDLTQHDGRRRTVTRGRIRPRSMCFSGAVQMPKCSCVEPNENK